MSIFPALKPWIIRKADFLAAALVLLFLVTGVLTLPNYGLTWDEGLGNLFFGERYLHFFVSFSQGHLAFDTDLPYNSGSVLNLINSPFHNVPNEFPPVADTFSAASMYLFSYALHWMNPVDGFHLFTVVLAAVFLWVFYRFSVTRLGQFEALLALVFIGTFPRFWGDMHFNVKDVPETLFFGLVILSFIDWMENPHLWKTIPIGILAGFALGTKANAIFIPVIIGVGLLPWNADPQDWKALFHHLKKSAGSYVLILTVAGFTYIASWPYLYANLIQNLRSYWDYIFSQGGRTGPSGLQIDPIRQVIFSMPEVLLAALLIGIVLAFIRIRQPFWRILIAWMVIPILRVSLPGMVNFDGIRHFLEFLPAATLIAAHGVGQLTKWLSRRRIALSVSRSVFSIILVCNIVGIYLVYFPFLHTYYNQLSGGLAGARNGWLGPEAGDYWNASYRQGMTWLSQNAPEGSIVRGMTAEWLVKLTGPLFLRPDMQVMSEDHLPDFNVLEQSEHPIYLMFVIRKWSHLDELAYCQEHKTPVYQIDIDGVPILQIFRFGKNGT